MAVNVNAWTANGVTHAFWGALVSGVPYGSTGTISTGQGAGMPLLRGVQNMQINEPDATRSFVLGDNGVITSFLQRVQELPGGQMTTSVFDQSLYSWARTSPVVALEEWDFTAFLTQCDAFRNVGLIVNSPAQAMEASNFGEAGFQVLLLFNALSQTKVLPQIQSANLQTYNNVLTLNPAAKTLWNTTLASTVGGYAGYSPYPVHMHTFIGNGSATTHTLTYTPAAANGAKVLVWTNGTLKAYTTDYTVNTSTKVLTFGTAPANNSINTILYQFLPDC